MIAALVSPDIWLANFEGVCGRGSIPGVREAAAMGERLQP